MKSLGQKIREFANRIGFDLVGFTSADPLPGHEQALQAWLSAGYAGEMAYMARDSSRRANPKQILPEAKTIICLADNYYPGDYPQTKGKPLALSGRAPGQASGSASDWPGWGGIEGEAGRPPQTKGRISRYAWGRDYHRVLEEKLDRLEEYLRKEAGRPLKIKRYVDYGPILERAYATRAGLGFIGKNTLLITPEFGSWVFLAELITDLELEYEDPATLSDGPASQCGSCSLCIDACPTGAIVAPFVLDSRRCISYLTIEKKGEIPINLQSQMEDWIFGCDVCQQVCPYNQQTPIAKNQDNIVGTGPWLDTQEVLAMDEETFKGHFRETPLLRSKCSGLQRNAMVVAKNLSSAQNRS